MKSLPERLLELLGIPVCNADAQILLQELGTKAEESMSATFEYPERGLTIDTDSARFSELVFFMSSEYPEFGWKDALPFGIENADQAKEVEQKLIDRKLIQKTLFPDTYKLEYRISQCDVAIYFDGENEQLSMLIVKYSGIFTDTGVLANSYTFKFAKDPIIKLFDKDTEIPEFNSLLVSTADEGQHAIEFEVFRGNEDSNDQLVKYSDYIVHQLPLLPPGTAQVEIGFEVMIDGNLKVTAKELSTNSRLVVTQKEV